MARLRAADKHLGVALRPSVLVRFQPYLDLDNGRSWGPGDRVQFSVYPTYHGPSICRYSVTAPCA